MIKLNEKRVLVTGGAGFIGSPLANELADENEVVVVDDGHLGIEENLRSDVSYSERSILEDDLPTAVDVVFHLAGLSSYVIHEDAPARGARVNVEGFVNVIEQARDDGCETVVYASTSSLYGTGNAPSVEGDELTVTTGYQASMESRERYAEYFAKHYDMNVAGMRLFSVYDGYGGNDGQKIEYANPVAQFADDIVHGRSPTLYGDGTQTRDFTHIEDVVEGLLVAAEHQLTGVYNLGTGRAVSFNELLELLTNELETDVRPEYIENPIPDEADIHDAMADISKLRSATGWEPTISLEEGIERVCSQYEVPQL